MKIGMLVTGGMDSTALLYEAVLQRGYTVYPITVDYGHAAFQKQEVLLRWHIEELRKKSRRRQALKVININFHAFQRYSPALFDATYKCNEEDPLNEWDKIRYEKSLVEGRNAIMVLYAMGFCASLKLDELWAGYLYAKVEWERRLTVKLLTGDNSPQFVDTMNILSLMGFSHPVRFRAPFYERRLSKADVYDTIGKDLGVDYSKTHSCYFPIPCHKCDNCLLRDEILLEDGLGL